jgi:membrane-associated phospholipid phosphatase
LAARDRPLGSTIAFVSSRGGPRWVQGWPRRGTLGRWVRAFDDTVDRWVERARDPSLDPLFYGLSSAADHALLWIALAALRAARRGDPAIALRFAAVLGVESALTNGPIKLAFRRIRPASAPPGPLPYGMHRPRTSAFPSGHATSAFAAATLLSEDSPAASAYWELAVLVAASRVYVRMHHASDAVAGTLLGLAMGQIAKRVLAPSARESPQ